MKAAQRGEPDRPLVAIPAPLNVCMNGLHCLFSKAKDLLSRAKQLNCRMDGVLVVTFALTSAPVTGQGLLASQGRLSRCGACDARNHFTASTLSPAT